MFFSFVKVWILFDSLFFLDVPFFDKGLIWPHHICSSCFTTGFLFYKIFIINDGTSNEFNFFIDFWKIARFVIIFIVKKVVLIFVYVSSDVVHNYVGFFCWQAVLVRWPLIGFLNLVFNEISFSLSWFFFDWRNGVFFFFMIWVSFRVQCLA